MKTPRNLARGQWQHSACPQNVSSSSQHHGWQLGTASMLWTHFFWSACRKKDLFWCRVQYSLFDGSYVPTWYTVGADPGIKQKGPDGVPIRGVWVRSIQPGLEAEPWSEGQQAKPHEAEAFQLFDTQTTAKIWPLLRFLHNFHSGLIK